MKPTAPRLLWLQRVLTVTYSLLLAMPPHALRACPEIPVYEEPPPYRPCYTYFDGSCWITDCYESGYSIDSCMYDTTPWQPTAPPVPPPPPELPLPPDTTGEPNPNPDPESCSEEGANPISVPNGNVSRRIDDLGVSSSRLLWYRHHNSNPRGDFCEAWLGNGGNWRHSWQFDLVSTHSPEFGEVLEFCYPAGRQTFLLRQPDGSYRAPALQPERARPLADGAFEVETRAGNLIRFIPAGPYGDHTRYRATELTTSEGETFSFRYDAKGLLVTIADADGHSLALTYRTVDLKGDPHQVVATAREVPAAGQWLELRVPSEYRNIPSTAFLVRAAPNGKIAEIQFVTEGDAAPLKGEAYGSYGANALDGDIASVWEATSTHRAVGLRVNSAKAPRLVMVRILAAAGAEQSLLHTRVVIERAIRPSSSDTAIASVTTSDGREVRYDYGISNQSMGEQAVLTAARYGDGTAANYRYSEIADAVGGSALLVEADDPRYGGPAKHIRYAYYRPRQDGVPAGTIKEEINPSTGKAWARLEVDPANPTIRTVHYSDDRFHTYRLMGDGSGRIVERKDSLGRTEIRGYPPGRWTSVSSRSDYAGRKTEWDRDDRNRIVSTKGFKGEVARQERDFRGRSTRAISAHGHSLQITRDDQGRIVRLEKSGIVTEIMRDTKGRITKTSKPGKTFAYEHDAKGRIIRVTDQLGAMTQFARDGYGQIVAATDAVGRTTRYTRNERGLVTKITTPDGLSRSMAYDKYGRKVAETDITGRTATVTYDNLSRVTERVDHLGRKTTYEYSEFPNGCGSCTLSQRPTRIVGPDGVVTTMLYDTEGRLLSRTVAVGTPAEATTIYAYDNDDNLVTVTDPEGRVTRYTYDDERHRLTATDSLGRVTKWAYDAEGRNTSITTADGGVTRFAYDEFNRRIATIDAAGNTTRFEYDAAGRMTALVDARRSTYRWEYDAAGRKTAMIYPDASRESWTYDAASRVLTSTTRAGQVKTSNYDAQGRLAAETWSGNAAPNTSYTYTALGQIATIDNGLAQLAYTYDAQGRMIAETVTRSGQAPLTTRYSYDTTTGRRTSLTYPSGAIVAQNYTLRGEVAAIMLDGAALARFDYDLNGQRTALSRANGVKTTWNTDAAGQLLSVMHTLGTATVASTTYELDAAGRRTAKTDESGWTERYGYDVAGQLTSADYFESPSDQQPARRVDYAYDALGNRERMAEVNRAQKGAAKNTNTRYAADALDQYTRIAVDGLAETPSYDSNGNLTRAQGVAYRYNARNQLIEVTTATERMTQVHDPKGRVIERRYFTKGSQAQWIEDSLRSLAPVYDAAWNVIEDRSLTGAFRARYVHGPRMDEILLIERSDGAKLCSLADGLGSTVVLTDMRGGVTQRYRYDAYGAPTVMNTDYSLSTTGSVALSAHRFLFTGREWLGIAGLQDSRFRVYSATLGRWLQTDPAQFLDGNNPYHYCLGWVTNARDPLGLAVILANPTFVGKSKVGGGLCDCVFTWVCPPGYTTEVGPTRYIDASCSMPWQETQPAPCFRHTNFCEDHPVACVAGVISIALVALFFPELVVVVAAGAAA